MSSKPTPEELERCVRGLVGRRLDQVWYRDVPYRGSDPPPPLWKEREDIDKTLLGFCLVAEDVTFTFNTMEGDVRPGLTVAASPEGLLDAFDHGRMEDVSQSTRWRAYVGERILDARVHWQWYDADIGWWQCARDLTLTFASGRTVCVTTADFDWGWPELESLCVIHGDADARRFQVGAYYTRPSPPPGAPRIPHALYRQALTLFEVMNTYELIGQRVERVWYQLAREEAGRAVWNVHPRYDLVPHGVCLATANGVITTTTGSDPEDGVYVLCDYAAPPDHFVMMDVSTESRWRSHLGQRIVTAQIYWGWIEDGAERICFPHDVALTFEGGGRVYLSSRDPRPPDYDHFWGGIFWNNSYELNCLTVFHGDRVARRFRVGPYAGVS